MQRVWKDYFKVLYNIDTQEQVPVRIYGFDFIQVGNYFGGELVRRNEVEVKVGALKNRKAAVRTRSQERWFIKSGGNMVAE